MQSFLILGDKSYVGLEGYKVETPTKRNELEYKKDKVSAKDKSKNLSTKRIKAEHVIAFIKKKNINLSFKAIANIFNLSKFWVF